MSEEKKFSENIDRLIAGGQPDTDENTSQDSSTAVEFSQKILQSRAEPSPRFQAELKEKLLARIGQEAEQREERAISLWDRLTGVFPKSPVWRTASVTVAVAILALVVMWSVGVFSDDSKQPMISATPPVFTPGPETGLDVDTLIDKAIYQPGEEVKISILFTNVTSDPLTLDSFPPALAIVGADRSDQVVRDFSPGSEAITVAPGEAATYTFTWDQRTNDGTQVTPGNYTLKPVNLQLEGNKGIDLSDTPLIIISPQNG